MSEHTNGSAGNGSVAPRDPGAPMPFDLVPMPLTTAPGTDFKAVAIGSGANLEALPTYFTDPLLQTGNMPGLAISAFNNRALRQGTFVASSLCLWISGVLNVYIPDDGSQINWVANFQSAISSLITASLPSTGVYLPIAGSPPGSPMTGHIRFSPSITTILANNTWYMALDTSATPRGLLLLGSDNNIYINDGSAAYVYHHGIPCADNNVYWSGRDTGGTPRPLIGMRNDNSVHIASGATGDIYFDETNATHHAGNIIMANNRFIFGNDTGGTARYMLGVGNNNALYIGYNYPFETDIYGNPIYFRNNSYALAQFQVNGYTYLQGGGRAYIPGGNDPWQVACDNGYYARIQYNIFGVRLWTAGALSNAYFAIADESAHAVRWQIDTNGNITVNNSETVNGNLYVNGGQNINGGLTVYNGLNVASGNGNVAGNLSIGGSITNCWDGHFGGSIWVGGLQATNSGGWFYFVNGVHAAEVYSRDNMWCANNLSAGNQVYGGYVWSTGDVHSNGNTTSSNGVYANYVQSNGDMRLGGCLYVNGIQVCNSNGLFYMENAGLGCQYAFYCNGASYFYNTVTVSSSYIQSAGNLLIANSTNILNWGGNSVVGANSYPFIAMVAYSFGPPSDARGKTDIAPVPSGCLDVVRQIEPKSYKLKDRPQKVVEIHSPVADGRKHAPDPELVAVEQEVAQEVDILRKRTYWGFIAQDVGRVMKDAGMDFGGRIVTGSNNDEMLSIVDMMAVLWAAVRELSDEVRQLKAA